MTGRWLTVSKTITRIYDATGRVLTCRQVLELGKRTGVRGLIVEHSHEHTRVLEQSVTDHLGWLAGKPTVGRWSRADDPGAFADRADHDTPSDEGDQQQ